MVCPTHILAVRQGDLTAAVIVSGNRLAPKHSFPAAIDDVAAAIRFLKLQSDKWKIARDRLVLTGESAGGLISALTGAILPGKNRIPRSCRYTARSTWNFESQRTPASWI